ncbi:MAG: T9SS type A sorting domain-containing protein [Bacteroidetes bacterium]|nr:T9SS type A sorting domain-containing protein [Bacteroidota bacterium]
MKKMLFLSLSILASILGRASDTLTVRQVYNFSIGDTFDYRGFVHSSDIGPSSYLSYYRHIVTQKNYSTNSDTIYYTYYDPDRGYSSDTITDLDSIAIFEIPNIYSSCNMSYTVDTGTFLGMPANSVDISCFESGGQDIVAESIGKVKHVRSSIDYSGTGYNASGWQLIYYAHDSIQAGTPYYIANGSTLGQYYMPLPERCAMWTRSSTGTLSPTSSATATVVEQIRTDSIIQWRGHSLVSLVARIFNGFTGHVTLDSLIGYFYNDTLHKSAYFLSDTSAPLQTIYNLSVYNGSPQGSCGYIQLDTVILGSVARLRVGTADPASNTSYCCTSVIAGIGSLYGLVPVIQLYHYYNGPACGQLIDFCVCGDHTYGQSDFYSCRLLTAVEDIPGSHSVYLYPNPTQGSVYLSLTDIAGYDGTFMITDFLGQQVYSSRISTGESTHDISSLPSGLYLWRLESDQGIIQTGKLIKE